MQNVLQDYALTLYGKKKQIRLKFLGTGSENLINNRVWKKFFVPLAIVGNYQSNPLRKKKKLFYLAGVHSFYN